MTNDADKQALSRALGRISSGLYILTTTSAGHSQAMLASWVQQASFTPPCVSIALACDRGILDRLQAGAMLALSIVPADDKSLLRRFARGIEPGADPFAGVTTLATPAGQIALADAIAWLECRIVTRVDFAADHCLLIAEVSAGQLLRDAPPFTHVRGNGLRY